MTGYLITIGVAICFIIGIFIMLVVICAGMQRRGTVMPKRKLMRIILGFLILLTVVGVVLVCRMIAAKDKRGVFDIGRENAEAGLLPFDELTHISRDKYGYAVRLEKSSTVEYESSSISRKTTQNA
jgi:hypothetical protein